MTEPTQMPDGTQQGGRAVLPSADDGRGGVIGPRESLPGRGRGADGAGRTALG